MAFNQLGRAIMKHQGDYSPTTDYVPLDCCYHDGSTYFCKEPTTGNAPPNSAYWVLLSTSASTVDRQAAEQAALAAAGSASSAANQVGLAAAQVTLAQGHATIANTKAGEAASSATAANDSAGQALASAGNAEVSAGEAEASATAAQASANDAAASAASVDGAALMAAVEGKADATHAHGDITTDGRVGTTPDLPLFTGPNGIVVARTMAEAAQVYQYTTPNILHNWDFRNPVNQRGVSGTISATGYFYDRWILNSGTVTVNAAYLTISAGGEIEQRIEGLYLAGETVTVSVMVGSTIYSGTGVFPTSAGTAAVTLTGFGMATLGYNAGYMFVRFTASGSQNIVAAKCELGTVSTLAYDPPMDRVMALQDCLPYFIKFGPYYPKLFGFSSGSGSVGELALSMPCIMRAAPTVSVSQTKIVGGGRSVTGSVTSTSIRGTQVRLNISDASGFSIDTTVVGEIDNAWFSSDL